MTAQKPGEDQASGGAKGAPLDEAKAWTSAVLNGMRDTLGDMLRAGRQASRDAADDYWEKFDKKTRYRREPEEDPEEASKEE